MSTGKIFSFGEQSSSFFECERSVQSVEKSLIATPVTKEMRDLLFSELQKTSEILGHLAKSSFVDELENKIIELYGRISHLSIHLEIEKLKEEISGLENCLLSYDNKEILRQVNNLKSHIVALCYECSLSQAEKEVIREANEMLQKAGAVMQGPSQSKRKKNHAVLEDDVDIDAIAPFFDIAYLIYKERFRESKKLYNQLDERSKKIFRLHYENFTDEKVDFEENPLVSIQALIASAYDLSNVDYLISDLSPEELQLMFLELDQILKNEI